MYAHERPGALGFVLLVAKLTGDERMCTAAAHALPSALAAGLTYMTSGTGWTKGAAQSAHMVAHGLASARCSPP